MKNFCIVTYDNIDCRFILLHMESSGRNAILIAKAFAKNGKPIPIIEIDREAYGDRKSIRANKEDNEHKLKKREDSELISTVKNITSNDNEER